MSAKSSLYSIGHGNKTIDEFIEELKSLNIEFLVDIRSKPYSKWHPQFNQHSLEVSLKSRDIKYLFLGDNLGGLPSDTSCYDKEGKVVYDIVKNKKFFKEGLNRLITADKKNIRLCIMCSEINPEECHRTKLIGKELLKSGISINHIYSKDKIRSQQYVMLQITEGLNPDEDLFGKEVNLTSKKTY